MSSKTPYLKVVDIVYQAGQRLKRYFGKIEPSHYKTTHYKVASPSDVVTKLDKETEDFLEMNLKKLDPTIGFTGEELGVRRPSDRFWLADPIDGTGYFIRGMWGCTIMLVLVEEGELKFSVIYDLVLDKMYTAEQGKGAYLNNRPIKVSDRSLKEAFLYVECRLENEKNLPKYLRLFKECVVLSSYPAGIHFVLTAEGKIDGRITFDPYGKDYDFAPGQLLVQEAGGVVKNIGSSTFDYKNLNFLAVNKKVYQDLTQGPNAIFPI